MNEVDGREYDDLEDLAGREVDGEEARRRTLVALVGMKLVAIS